MHGVREHSFSQWVCVRVCGVGVWAMGQTGGSIQSQTTPPPRPPPTNQSIDDPNQ
jgi:hypothetical protein